MILKKGKAMETIENRKPKDPIEVELPDMEENFITLNNHLDEQLKELDFENELTAENKKK
jgi:hypothetical protein